MARRGLAQSPNTTTAAGHDPLDGPRPFLAQMGCSQGSRSVLGSLRCLQYSNPSCLSRGIPLGKIWNLSVEKLIDPIT